MGDTTQLPGSYENLSTMEQASSRLPSSHSTQLFPIDNNTSLITLLALFFPLFLVLAFRRHIKMQQANKKPFPFMNLPQELRDMVYEHFIEDPSYPPPPPSQHHRSSLDWILPGLRSSPSASSRSSRKGNWIFLANKQVYKEYMDMVCKRTTFHLLVSPQTFQPHPDTSNPPPSGSDSESDNNNNRVWNIGQDTLKNLRTCSLKLVTTSAMLGVTDPRNMTSSDWTLARQIREELKAIENVTNLTLDAKALGDPLWNPLWIWYHSSQSFKAMGTPDSDTIPIGPKLTRITFSLDTWSPGENYLERDPACEGRWTWYCMKGHDVGADIGPAMTVREFCGKLYQECGICRPSSENGHGD